MTTFGRAIAAEALGTALLLAAVVGSGIMGERLAGDNAALVLLANSVATGCVLFALIVTFTDVSGAHFNPVVTLFAACDGTASLPRALAYVIAQAVGAVSGVVVAHVMFGLPHLQDSSRVRTGLGHYVAEAVATFGLVMVIRGVMRRNVAVVAAAVGCYITAAYWFTASTSFANPAVTFARSLTDSFAGIRQSDVLAFIAAQVAGGVLGYVLSRWLYRSESHDPNA